MTAKQRDTLEWALGRLDAFAVDLAALDQLPLDPGPDSGAPGAMDERVAYQFGRLQQRAAWIKTNLLFVISELKAAAKPADK